MAFKCLLSTSAWDAVAYVRARTEDTLQPPVIPDSSYKLYCEDAVEEFSRHAPLSVQATASFVTVADQQRYVLTTLNGFPLTPFTITEVGYSGGDFNAADEMSYLQLLPVDPSSDLLSSEFPSTRIIREETYNEVAHWNRGFYDVVTDITGTLALDLYPIPTSAGNRIRVKYTAQHPIVVNVNGDFVIASIPEAYKRYYGMLLHSIILDQEVERLSRFRKVKSGIIEVNTNPKGLMDLAEEIRDRVFNELGGNKGVGSVGS